MLKEKSRDHAGHRLVPFLDVKLFGKDCDLLGPTNANSIHEHLLYNFNKDEPRCPKKNVFNTFRTVMQKVTKLIFFDILLYLVKFTTVACLLDIFDL